MRRLPFLFASLFVLHPVPGCAGLPEEVKSNLACRVEVGECPGIIAGVATGSQQDFIAHGRVGESGSAIKPDTIFEIGSISKTFTALLYQIATNGALMKPGDRLADLLPARVKLSRPLADISLQDLATHRSGLPRMPTNFNPADTRNPYADYSVAQFYDWLAKVHPSSGRQFQYSNAGMGLLGHVLELKTDCSYEALVRGWITDPLGLVDTRVTLTADQRRRVAIPHADGRPLPLWDIPTLAGAGALRSTARDLLRWASLQAGIIDCKLATPMKQCHQSQIRTETDGVKAGTGWFLTPSHEGTIVWHSGETGGTRSWIGFIRSRKVAAVVLANGNEQIDDIGFHLLSPEHPMRVPEKEIEICESALRRCEGTYELGKSRLIVKPTGRRLSVQVAGQAANPAYASSETEFFFRVMNARLIFEPGADGLMKSVTLRQNGCDQRASRISP